MLTGSSLATLQRYLEISDQQVVEAVNAIGAHPPRRVAREPESEEEGKSRF